LFARMTADAIVVGEDICYFCFARVGRDKKEIVPKSDVARLGAQPSERAPSGQRCEGGRVCSSVKGRGYVADHGPLPEDDPDGPRDLTLV
jgi:hypothetical protein